MNVLEMNLGVLSLVKDGTKEIEHIFGWIWLFFQDLNCFLDGVVFKLMFLF